MGCNTRLIIALVIAVIGIVGYLSKRSVNPVTGEKQYVSLSPDQEIALGLQAAPQMAQQMGGVVHLLDDDQTINAFALPGGQIFITRALYGKLENEAQLAGVLGHEIGHVLHRHAAEHMAKGELGGMLATAVGVGASDERGGGYGAAVAAQMANQVVQLKFSRNDEKESDTFGLRYMAQAGYDPSAMLKVMQVLQAASKGGRTPEILATHPAPQDRLDDIDRRIKELFPNGVPPALTGGRALP
jgi:predicted Zn-dependent protease